MYLDSLKAIGYRNLVDETVRLVPGRNLFLGGNGQGKTNLLEAITVLATLRSFRTPHLRRVVRHGERRFVLRGTVATESGRTVLAQEVSFEPSLQRKLLVDGKRAPVAAYIDVLRVEVLTGRREDIVWGEPRIRRAFIDRLAFQLKPRVFEILRTYRKVLTQRNASLQRMGSSGEAVVWDQQLAAAAAEVVIERRRALEMLRVPFESMIDEVGLKRIPGVKIRYRGESWLPDEYSKALLAEKYEMMYHSARERDGRLGFTGYGPHRHDVALTVDGRTAAESLSSGQGKLVAALLRLAAVELVEQVRPSGGPGIVVMDDVDSELDREASAALLERVGTGRQVILSSPRATEAQDQLMADAVFWVREGAVLHEADGETLHDGTIHSG